MTGIDYLIIGIMLVYGLIGYSKGFIRGFAGTVSYLVSFIIAKIGSVMVSKMIYAQVVGPKIYSEVYRVVSTTLTNTQGESLESVRESLITSLSGGIPIAGRVISETLESWNVYNTLKDGGAEVSKIITEAVVTQVRPIIEGLVAIMVLFILYIILRIVTSIVLGVLNKAVLSLNITRGADSIMGFGVGLVKGVIVAIIVSGVLYVIEIYLGKGLLGIFTMETFTGSKILNALGVIVKGG